MNLLGSFSEKQEGRESIENFHKNIIYFCLALWRHNFVANKTAYI